MKSNIMTKTPDDRRKAVHEDSDKPTQSCEEFLMKREKIHSDNP